MDCVSNDCTNYYAALSKHRVGIQRLLSRRRSKASPQLDPSHLICATTMTSVSAPAHGRVSGTESSLVPTVSSPDYVDASDAPISAE